jgi:hypothetical protein
MLVTLFLIFTGSAYGGELKRVGVQVGHIYNLYDTYIPKYTGYELDPVVRYEANRDDKIDETWAYELRLFMDYDIGTSFLGTTYWNQEIIGRATTVQFRYVAWDFEVGHRFTDSVGIFYHHISEHVMEDTRTRYPMLDTVGIRLCFGGTEC